MLLFFNGFFAPVGIIYAAPRFEPCDYNTQPSTWAQCCFAEGFCCNLASATRLEQKMDWVVFLPLQLELLLFKDLSRCSDGAATYCRKSANECQKKLTWSKIRGPLASKDPDSQTFRTITINSVFFLIDWNSWHSCLNWKWLSTEVEGGEAAKH